MKLLNTTRNVLLADNVEVADTFALRSKGLLGRKNLVAGHAMMIKPCNSIHTFCMQFPIDVIFVHKTGRILRVYDTLNPGRLTPIVWGSAYVVELPAGILSRTRTCSNDNIALVP